jgi:hypothetical protein
LVVEVGFSDFMVFLLRPLPSHVLHPEFLQLELLVLPDVEGHLLVLGIGSSVWDVAGELVTTSPHIDAVLDFVFAVGGLRKGFPVF